MAWIESHQEVARHPKTRRLARLLGVSVPTVIGHLHCLWWWALDFAQDGEVTKYQPDDLAEGALWNGDPLAFVDALVAVGFLDRLMPDGLRLHDWYQYAGKLIDRRKSDAERKRNARQSEAAHGHPMDIRGTSNGHPADIRGTSTVTVQNHTEPSDPTVDTDGEGTSGERMPAPARSLGALALSPSPTAVASVSPSPSPSSASSSALVPIAPSPPKLVALPSSPPAPPMPPTPRKPRAPDLLWDACVLVCDGNGKGPTNDAERGKWNKGLKSLRQSGATAEEITLRAERYRRRFGEGIALNPLALANNWSTLSREMTEVSDHEQHNHNHNHGSARFNGRGHGGSSQPYNPQLPTAEDFREWARKEREAGRPVIGG